mgnify:CR=1 FL=1
MKKLNLSLLFLLFAGVVSGNEPLPFNITKLESVNRPAEKETATPADPVIQNFARLGFSQDDLKLEKWSDPMLEERIASLEKKVDDLVQRFDSRLSASAQSTEKSVEYRTESRLTGYRNYCDEFGNCYSEPIYGDVRVPLNELSSPVANASFPAQTVSYNYSPTSTIAVSSAQTWSGSPRAKVDSNGTVYKVAPLRTFIRRLWGL